MIKCLCCKGSGEQILSVHENGKVTPFKMNCVWCDGKGKMTDEEHEDYLYEQNMWCKCKVETGTRYYENGEHSKIHKHHYRCTKCKKVKQIG